MGGGEIDPLPPYISHCRRGVFPRKLIGKTYKFKMAIRDGLLGVSGSLGSYTNVRLFFGILPQQRQN